jgi:hypothetical protein
MRSESYLLVQFHSLYLIIKSSLCGLQFSQFVQQHHVQLMRFQLARPSEESLRKESKIVRGNLARLRACDRSRAVGDEAIITHLRAE